MHVRVCVRVRVRACARAYVRACVRVRINAHASISTCTCTHIEMVDGSQGNRAIVATQLTHEDELVEVPQDTSLVLQRKMRIT